MKKTQLEVKETEACAVDRDSKKKKHLASLQIQQPFFSHLEMWVLLRLYHPSLLLLVDLLEKKVEM